MGLAALQRVPGRCLRRCLGATMQRNRGAHHASRNTLPSPGSTTSLSAVRPPLLTPSALDAALVPEPGFAHAFLTRGRRPRFRFIAPGLALPPANAPEFAAVQLFTRLPRGSAHAIPPVCLLPVRERPTSPGPGTPSVGASTLTLPHRNAAPLVYTARRCRGPTSSTFVRKGSGCCCRLTSRAAALLVTWALARMMGRLLGLNVD